MNTGLSLYKVADDLIPLLENGVDEDGVISPELGDALTRFDNKGLSVSAFIMNCEANAKMMKDAEERIAKNRKSLERKADSLKEYLKFNMKRTGTTSISCPEYTVKLYVGRDASVEIYDVKQIPSDYIKEPKPPEPSPDKVLIKKAINDGYEVAGARIVKNDRLEIK